MKKLFIANRAEIAARVIRAAKALNIKTVAIYSNVDRNSAHLDLADEIYNLGQSEVSNSYLNEEKILSLLVRSKADAIHPGYGFFAENFRFAEAVRKLGITFVGPSSETLMLLGKKNEARAIAAELNIPTIPGYDGKSQSDKDLLASAKDLGFPLMIKALDGGGGRGMRRVDNIENFNESLQSARREALSFFGNEKVILERHLSKVRHIEVQLLGDNFGNIVHLFERDCSLQRKYQKVIEEAPARNLSPSMRKAMLEAAVKFARRVNLTNATTVEFLVEEDSFYFIEANPRLQVEHPITEAVTGLDLVQLQLHVASNKPLPFTQSEIQITGHAIEARICAEIPTQNFRSSTGIVQHFSSPHNIRFDHCLKVGHQISTYYDSLLGKLICHSQDSIGCWKLLERSLDKFRLFGCETNLSFLTALTTYLSGNDILASTSFIDKEFQPRLEEISTTELLDIAVATALLNIYFIQESNSLFQSMSFFCNTELYSENTINAPYAFELTSALFLEPILVAGRITNVTNQSIEFCINEKTLIAKLQKISAGDVTIFQIGLNSKDFIVSTFQNEHYSPTLHLIVAGHYLNCQNTRHQSLEKIENLLGATIRSPLPGKVLSVNVNVGSKLEDSDPIAVIESMKMEHVIYATSSGVVTKVDVKSGDNISQGDLIAIIESD